MSNRKLSSVKGSTNPINLYSTNSTTNTHITTLSVCNSANTTRTFKLWQITPLQWTSEWEMGENNEPEMETISENRIFFNKSVEPNTSFIISTDLYMGENQYLIFEGDVDTNIIIWGKETTT